MEKINDTGMLLPGAPKLRAKSMIESQDLDSLWGNIADSLGVGADMLSRVDYDLEDSSNHHLLEEWQTGLSKNKLWPSPDYAALLESGIPLQAVMAIKEIRDSYPPKVLRPYPDNLQKYVKAILAGKKWTDALIAHWNVYAQEQAEPASFNNIALQASILARFVYASDRANREYPAAWIEGAQDEAKQRRLDAYRGITEQLAQLGQNALAALDVYLENEGHRGMVRPVFRQYLRQRDKRHALDMLLRNNLYFKATTSVARLGLSSVEPGTFKTDEQIGQRFDFYKLLGVKPKALAPKDTAPNALDADTGGNSEPPEPKKPRRPVRLSVEEAEALLIPGEHDQEYQNLDFLIEQGMARGAQIGEWVPQKERPALVANIARAFGNLASVNRIVPPLVGLGRPLTEKQQTQAREGGLIDNAYTPGAALGLALGARGRSKAAAHYEPGLHVINLTRLNGAGSLAHEWGHALDETLTRELVNLGEVNKRYHERDIRRITGGKSGRITALSEWMAVFWHVRTLRANRDQLEGDVNVLLAQEIIRGIRSDADTPEARKLLMSVGKFMEELYCVKRTPQEMLDELATNISGQIVRTAESFLTHLETLNATFSSALTAENFVNEEDASNATGLYILTRKCIDEAIRQFETTHNHDLADETKRRLGEVFHQSLAVGGQSIGMVEKARNMLANLDFPPRPALAENVDPKGAKQRSETDHRCLLEAVKQVVLSCPVKYISSLSSHLSSLDFLGSELEKECKNGLAQTDMQKRRQEKFLSVAQSSVGFRAAFHLRHDSKISSKLASELEKTRHIVDALRLGTPRVIKHIHPQLLETLADSARHMHTSLPDWFIQQANAIAAEHFKAEASLVDLTAENIQQLSKPQLITVVMGCVSQAYLDHFGPGGTLTQLSNALKDTSWLSPVPPLAMVCLQRLESRFGVAEVPGQLEQILKEGVASGRGWKFANAAGDHIRAAQGVIPPSDTLLELAINFRASVLSEDNYLGRLETTAATLGTSFRYMDNAQRRETLESILGENIKGYESLLSPEAMQHYHANGSLQEYELNIPDGVRVTAERLIEASHDLAQSSLDGYQNDAFRRLRWLRSNASIKTVPKRVISNMLLYSAAYEGAYLTPTGNTKAASRSYWSTGVEVFARAFETVVHDALERDRISDPYLVTVPSKDHQAISLAVEDKQHDTWLQNGPTGRYYDLCYPAGRERSVLLERFDNIAAALGPLLSQRFPEAVSLHHELERAKKKAHESEEYLARIDEEQERMVSQRQEQPASVARTREAPQEAERDLEKNMDLSLTM